LVADEPTAGLDPDAQLMVPGATEGPGAAGQAVLVSLHDLALAARFADRIVVLDQRRTGRGDGAPLEALTPEVMARVFGLEGALGRGAGRAPERPLFRRLALRRRSASSPA
jgi:iron complex transport system ATP-binding protein